MKKKTRKQRFVTTKFNYKKDLISVKRITVNENLEYRDCIYIRAKKVKLVNRKLKI